MSFMKRTAIADAKQYSLTQDKPKFDVFTKLIIVTNKLLVSFILAPTP
ncbi:MAG: hypothetical protein KME54_07195 [Tolypothrix brevis GSE-NOS-MK-07-07A]|jgi:hypothetical protein|nr:hypothetical protein [Tolypothrix brevis GSE-NOS-MK-07-07A]